MLKHLIIGAAVVCALSAGWIGVMLMSPAEGGVQSEEPQVERDAVDEKLDALGEKGVLKGEDAEQLVERLELGLEATKRSGGYGLKHGMKQLLCERQGQAAEAIMRRRQEGMSMQEALRRVDALASRDESGSSDWDVYRQLVYAAYAVPRGPSGPQFQDIRQRHIADFRDDRHLECLREFGIAK